MYLGSEGPGFAASDADPLNVTYSPGTRAGKIARWKRKQRKGKGWQENDSAKHKANDREEFKIEAWERGLRAVGGAFERRYRFEVVLG